MNLNPDKYNPLAVASLSDEIAERLHEAILDGEIELGAHLNQDALCDVFDVSRTPVREALTRLSGARLVSLRPNRGATVRVPERSEIKEAYELRAELEGFAAELAAQRRDPAALRAMGRAQEDLTAIVEGVDKDSPIPSTSMEVERRIATDSDVFHEAVLDAAGNAALREAVIPVLQVFPRTWMTRAMNGGNELVPLNIEHHTAVLAAIRDRRAADARALMQQHVERAGLLLLEYLDQSRFWDDPKPRA